MLKGININVRGGYMPSNELAGNTNFVRTVFQRWNGQSVQSLNETFQYYDAIVKLYNSQSIQVLFVLNQQTYGDGGNPPWIGGQSWDEYATVFAQYARDIAKYYSNANVALQIWNEPDIRGESSIALDAPHYGLILKKAILAIREVNSSIKILGAGLASGAGNQVKYWRDVEKVFNGKVPVDYLATHPYGQYVGVKPNIPSAWFGRLDEHIGTLRTLGYPIFVTEIGIAENEPLPESSYSAIADYMRSTYNYLNTNGVQGYGWWAYHDGMRWGGIVNPQFARKQPIYDTYIKLANQFVDVPNNAVRVTVKTGGSVNVRSGRGMLYSSMGSVRNGQLVEALDCAEGIKCKLGNPQEWVMVRHNQRVGYINGEFLEGVR